ncbi:Uncharacterised protein [uncultured archaeon]|nr:Uncharacterised protein [uncultured archaeon]
MEGDKVETIVVVIDTNPSFMEIGLNRDGYSPIFGASFLNRARFRVFVSEGKEGNKFVTGELPVDKFYINGNSLTIGIYEEDNNLKRKITIPNRESQLITWGMMNTYSGSGSLCFIDDKDLRNARLTRLWLADEQKPEAKR